MLSRVFKDIYPRFQTMRGRYVERKGGWDCHGLPVEIAVEQKLGITSKAQIEQEVGIERFNAECRASVFTFLEDWNRLTERIGFWLDLEGAYRTLDETYIESVWWALSEIHARGLLYEGHKVVPYCPRCETTLSSHEVALGYRDVVDPSVYLKLPVHDGPERLLVWTTTPWTLPGNVALAVSPHATYVRARAGGEVFLLAEARLGAVLGEEGVELLERLSGRELVERYGFYEGPIFAATDRRPGPLPILADEFVTTEDGTGIVHLAPAFGEDDYRVAAASPEVPFDPAVAGSLYNPVRPDGTYDERVLSRDGTSYGGRFVKDEQLTAELLEDLSERGLVLKVEDYEHAYPHCWRSDNALIYYAKPSWYIATSKLRSELLAANETVNWHPPHVRHGRFGDWLANNVDWALSRERYWGTPLPVWRCPQGHLRVIGSFGELTELSGSELGDHHRPYVDDLSFPCTEDGCEQPMRRVPEVIDVWFDSGAMPFAQHHSPFEHEELSARPTRRSSSARPRTRPGGGSTRCWRSPCCLPPGPLRERRLPRVDPRPGGSEDVQVTGQRGRALGGAGRLWGRRAAVVLLHRQAALGRVPLLLRDGRRGGAAVPQAAVVPPWHSCPLRRCGSDRQRPPANLAGSAFRGSEAGHQEGAAHHSLAMGFRPARGDPGRIRPNRCVVHAPAD